MVVAVEEKGSSSEEDFDLSLDSIQPIRTSTKTTTPLPASRPRLSLPILPSQPIVPIPSPSTNSILRSPFNRRKSDHVTVASLIRRMNALPPLPPPRPIVVPLEMAEVRPRVLRSSRSRVVTPSVASLTSKLPLRKK